MSDGQAELARAVLEGVAFNLRLIGGLYSDYGVARDLIPVTKAEKPDPATRARYNALYELFQQSYVALVPI